MKQCGRRFDFVGVVSDVVSKLLQLVDFGQRSTCPSNNAADDNLRISRTPTPRPGNWVDFVSTQPQLYFRLSVSLDFALSKGKYPFEHELPGWIINPSPPQVPAGQIELPRPTNRVSTMSPGDSFMGSRSLMRETAFNRSQQFHLDESTSLFPPTSPRRYRNGADFLDGSIFELGTSTESGFVFDGMDEIADYNENDDDGSPFGFNMLSYFSDMPATGG
jgi:hypothetical protein